MSRYIPDTLRKQVAQRANFRCEYYRLPQQVSGFSFEIDHITSLKHGGKTRFDNLAYACPICNGNKGSDLGTILAQNSKHLVRFFNPRTDDWFDHFELQNGVILAKSDIGAATIKIFDFNREQDILYRQKLSAIGLYP